MVDVIHARGIDDELWKMFKQAVIGKHGKLHGVLGEELSHALQLYLREYSERERTRAQKPGGGNGADVGAEVEPDIVISVERRNENSGKRSGSHQERRETSGSGRVDGDISYASIAPMKPHYSRKKLDAAKMHLEENGMWEAIHNGGFVHMNAVKRVIREVVGYDKRTIDKYFNLLCEVYALTTDGKGKVIPSPC